MIKTIRFALIGVASLAAALGAQSANYRAQARWYTGKTALEQRRYNDAAKAAAECRELLQGKTNQRIQYLLVIALHHAGRFQEAQKETQRFFDLVERREESERFTKDVDELTPDETRELTMLFDEIDARAGAQAESAPVTDINALFRKSSGAVQHGNNMIFYYNDAPFRCDDQKQHCALTYVAVFDNRTETDTTVIAFQTASIEKVFVWDEPGETRIALNIPSNAVKCTQFWSKISGGSRVNPCSGFNLPINLNADERTRIINAFMTLKQRATRGR